MWWTDYAAEKWFFFFFSDTRVAGFFLIALKINFKIMTHITRYTFIKGRKYYDLVSYVKYPNQFFYYENEKNHYFIYYIVFYS